MCGYKRHSIPFWPFVVCFETGLWHKYGLIQYYRHCSLHTCTYPQKYTENSSHKIITQKNNNSKSKGGNKSNLLNVTDTICKQSCKDWPSWNIQASSPGNFPLHTHTRAHTHKQKHRRNTAGLLSQLQLYIICFIIHNLRVIPQGRPIIHEKWLNQWTFFKLINKILLHNVYESLFLHCFNVV